MNKDYFYLGKITKPFGYKGELFIYLDTDEPKKYENLDAVFIQLDDELLPFIIEQFGFRDEQTAVVKFKDVDFEKSKELIGAELYLPLSMLPPLTDNKFYYHEVIGFQVIDQVKGEIGFCTDFIDISKQPIMQIDYHGQEILIPAIDEFFDRIDRENKIIYITAPDGLIDVYIEK